MKVGFVSIVGRPNAGKSTLINSIIGSKVAIVSDKAHTTRNNIQGIYNDDNSQIIFIDTPGIHKSKNKLDSFMQESINASLDGTDALIFMLDGLKPFEKEDLELIEKYSNSKVQ